MILYKANIISGVGAISNINHYCILLLSIQFDYLTRFKKICMIIHFCIKWHFLAEQYLIKEKANTVPIG